MYALIYEIAYLYPIYTLVSASKLGIRYVEEKRNVNLSHSRYKANMYPIMWLLISTSAQRLMASIVGTVRPHSQPRLGLRPNFSDRNYIFAAP